MTSVEFWLCTGVVDTCNCGENGRVATVVVSVVVRGHTVDSIPLGVVLKKVFFRRVVVPTNDFVTVTAGVEVAASNVPLVAVVKIGFSRRVVVTTNGFVAVPADVEVAASWSGVLVVGTLVVVSIVALCFVVVVSFVVSIFVVVAVGVNTTLVVVDSTVVVSFVVICPLSQQNFGEFTEGRNLK